MTASFDTRQFLYDKFGNLDGLLEIVGQSGIGVPQRETARKWFERRTIPAEWWPVLLAALELEHGEPISLTPYLVGNTEDGDIFS